MFSLVYKLDEGWNGAAAAVFDILPSEHVIGERETVS
jgi:hypothetical protein